MVLCEVNRVQEQSEELVASPSVDGDVVASAPDGDAGELERIRHLNLFTRAMDEALTDVRQRSYEGKLTKSSRWRKLAIAPEGMDDRAFEEQVLTYIETHEHAEDAPAMGKLVAPKPLAVQLEGADISPDEPLPDLDVTDIALIFGKKGIYLYSKALMSHSFAHALYQTAENSAVATFVDVVRSESRSYPRPVAIGSFANPPYLWGKSKTLEVFEQVRQSGSFDDIHMVRTSANEPYFYSTLYLSDAQGKALAEWYGVEKGLNP